MNNKKQKKNMNKMVMMIDDTAVSYVFPPN